MTYLNRSLFFVGLLSAVLGLTRVASAGTTIQLGDSTIVKKDTIAAVATVPDSLLKERLAKLQKDIPLNYHKSVQAYVDYFTFRKPSKTKLMMERMPLFFPLYERMLAQYGLPDELKFLSIVESALNPRAISHAGAGGLWQIMPGTGRDLRLYQDDYVDERMDPVKATEAACKYLRDLYTIFGDWELALAGYNCGPGAVKRAMRRSGGDSFYTIYDALPKETRGYVPQFVAFTYLMHHCNDHGIVAENYEFPIPHDTIQVSGYFNLETFAKHSTMPLADLQKMNPAITTTILPEYTRQYPLRVPRQQYAYFTSHRRAVMDSASQLPPTMAHTLLAQAEDIRYGTDSMKSWSALGSNPLAHMTLDETLPEETLAVAEKSSDKSAKLAAKLAIAEPADEPVDEIEKIVARKPRKQLYVVKRGDNLGEIADRYAVELYDLKKWNHLRSSTIQRGQKLIILKEVTETRAEQLADQGSAKSRKKAEVMAQTRQFKPRYHRVQDGDTLWNIAQRYDGLTIDRLKKMNNIRGNSLRPGQKLIVG
ncbi:lytic transglycosylase domain-containing protein [Spirosoma utsteinense]|uniref:Membrane-bound lytic murein transglycosylase D n=1 Tax=Spirosoma utsteinense TaxID=2585773 RepID=A0ABR6W485_9BACT|nr:lytic transglycosylase domain-containing protein [Spirosoma utsteinense]MBC3787072.1 membrane-bound lytic murein transglycosylase D [Spirosoma utsteinense]MBC3791379.1 membrane-bound lytic murein transglycosylase D [Spirosoma utsteinense]